MADYAAVLVDVIGESKKKKEKLCSVCVTGSKIAAFYRSDLSCRTKSYRWSTVFTGERSDKGC